jgi:hypothetical protein
MRTYNYLPIAGSLVMRTYNYLPITGSLAIRTYSAVTIQPQMEPEAEIEIPTNTFDTPGDLLFNVS